MSEIRVRVDQQNSTKVRVGQQNAIKVLTALVPEPGEISLSNATDVDLTNLQNGMVLVYDSSTQKWTATLDLTPLNAQNLDINGGTF